MHANTVAVHPLLGSHVRLSEEPERHVWQSEIGTEALPWLGDHQIHGAAALPGAAYCEMALTAARTVLGETTEVRDVRFEQTAAAGRADPRRCYGDGRGAGCRRLRGGDQQEVANAPGGPRRCCTPLEDVAASRRPHTTSRPLAAIRPVEGDDIRQEFDLRGIQYGPAFTGLTAAHTAEGAATRCWPRSPCPVRSAHNRAPTGCIPPCWTPASSRWRRTPASAPVRRAAAAVGRSSHARLRPARNARYCLTTVTSARHELEADLDVLDEHGAVLLAVHGLQIGTGASASSDATAC